MELRPQSGTSDCEYHSGIADFYLRINALVLLVICFASSLGLCFTALGLRGHDLYFSSGGSVIGKTCSDIVCKK
ncbi:MAG: hypothetical protein ACR2PO_16535 [Methyloligellaceae bacterium]